MDTLTHPARPTVPQLLLSESADIYPKTAISTVIVYSQDKTDFQNVLYIASNIRKCTQYDLTTQNTTIESRFFRTFVSDKEYASDSSDSSIAKARESGTRIFTE